jgi:anti-sigma regulatory factor (Ser/Thr protein kinase)
MIQNRLTIAGVLDEIPRACEFAVNAAREAGLDEESIHHCHLAVDETCTNIVEHAYDGQPGAGYIEIICQADPTHFTITIKDDGPPFDPLARPDPDPGEPLESRKTGGWGIYFIKNVMDDVRYLYDGQRNTLIMRKNI